MSNKNDLDFGYGVVVEKARPKLKPPSMYKVVMLNDDFTPMDFVVEVLQRYFGMNHERAVRVMMDVHARGRAVCGVYTAEIAETKVAQVNDYSRDHEYPLLCLMEEA